VEGVRVNMFAGSRGGFLMQEENTLGMDDIVTVICPEHGDFDVKVKDHLGLNDEQVAYGCPKCGGERFLE